jgi:hypothetical protein
LYDGGGLFDRDSERRQKTPATLCALQTTKHVGMRSRGLFLLLVSCLLSGGCVDRLLGLIMAPQSAAAAGAAKAAQAVASGPTGESLDSLGKPNNTVSDLDRILNQHPDAENAGKLRQLRDQLHQQAPLENKNKQSDRGSNRSGPVVEERQRESDRRVKVPPRRTGDRVDLDVPDMTGGKRGLGPDHPPAVADTGLVDPWQPRQHQMSTEPVRLNSPSP